MRLARVFCIGVLLTSLCHGAAWSATIAWTRMTGQYPVECSPLLVAHKGKPAALAINRRGQVMLWALDGRDLGSGQDGLVAQLPDTVDGKPRFWSSTPANIGTKAAARYLFCSNEGLAIALDAEFKEAWRYQLPKDTVYLSSTAARVVTPSGEAWCLGDKSGTVTALDAAGHVVWQKKLEGNVCNAPLQSFEQDGHSSLLAAVDNKLCCLSADGQVAWSRDLGGRIISRPKVLTIAGKRMIVCGAGDGVLAALSMTGEVLWQTPIGDEIDSSIAYLPERRGAGLILCRGLWGGLHALDADGHLRWSHLFSSKGRGCPLVFDADGDGNMDVMVTGYGQHAYVIDHDGKLIDDLRAAGSITGSPILIDKRRVMLVLGGSLLAYGIDTGACRSPYGDTGTPANVTATLRDRCPEQSFPSMLIQNPNGALLRWSLTAELPGASKQIRGGVTARTHFDVLPIAAASATKQTLRVETMTARGQVRDVLTQEFPAGAGETRAVFAGPSQAVSIDGLYQGETGSSTLHLGCPTEAAARVRLEFAKPKKEDGTTFAGSIRLFEVVRTGTFNGEPCADALVELGDGNVLTSVKNAESQVEIQASAGDTPPGVYKGTVRVVPLLNDGKALEVPVCIEVLPLAMRRPFPLKACNWDYVPNEWFPDKTEAVLDDMSAHGITIFPRHRCIPKATMDAQGKLTFDNTILDEELALLKERGTILFQIGHPPITFATPPTDAQKRAAEIAYLQQWRDYLKSKGLGYDRYAFYPVDEPGLDFGANTVPTFLEAARLFREADPNFRIYTDPVPGLSKKDFERIRPFVDVWCPNMRLVTGLIADDPRIDWIMKSGKPVWSYECVGLVRSLSPLRYNRANAWRAYAFGLNGIGFWTHSTQPYNNWYAGKTVDDEYALVYPGRLPVPSVRWEAVRSGLQDVAALDMLKKAADAAPSTSDGRRLKKEAYAELALAKRDVLEMSDQVYVESRDFLKAGDRRMWHTMADAETYRLHRARVAELTMALQGVKP